MQNLDAEDNFIIKSFFDNGIHYNLNQDGFRTKDLYQN